MRVFNKQTQTNIHSGSSKNAQGKKSIRQRPAIPKRLSRAEVQARFEQLKLEKATGTSHKKLKHKYERSQMSQYMNGGVFKNDKRPQNIPNVETVVVGKELELNDSPNTADYVLNSDVASNKPDAAETREKLKGVLSGGSFNFSDKERDVLSKILAD
jgi:hypothetical protein